jgi:hypothetical protein
VLAVLIDIGATSEAKCHDSFELVICKDGEGSLECGRSCGPAVGLDALACRNGCCDFDRIWLESNLSRRIVVVAFSSTIAYGSSQHTESFRHKSSQNQINVINA